MCYCMAGQKCQGVNTPGAGQSSINVLRLDVLYVLPRFPDTHCNVGLIAHLYWLPSFSCITSSLPIGFSCTSRVNYIPSILISGSAAGRTHKKTCTSEIAKLPRNKQVTRFPWFPQNQNDTLRWKCLQIRYSLPSVKVLLGNKFYVPYFSHLSKVLVTWEGRLLWNRHLSQAFYLGWSKMTVYCCINQLNDFF